jgi:phage gp29-like protein
VPTIPLPSRVPSQEPGSLLRVLDVDRVHAILDTAQAGNTQELFALYRDIILSSAHLQTEFAKRKLAVLGDPLSVQPWKKRDPLDESAASVVHDEIGMFPGFMGACSHLLDSALYPVSLVEKVFVPRGEGFGIRELRPVPHTLLDFSQDGRLRIWDVDPVTGCVMSTSHAADPHRYIIHRGHLLSSPDHLGGPLRSLVFWWLFATMDREWWARWLDRYGAPFLLGKYDQGDDQSRSTLEAAFSTASRLWGIVVSKETDVEIKQASAAGSANAYEKFHDVCNREISKLVLGQTLSAEARGTGLGSGVSDAQERVRNDFRDFDAMMLGKTLREQLIVQYLAINGIRARAPRILWGSSDNIKLLTAASGFLAKLKEAGFRLTNESLGVLNERIGLEIEPLGIPQGVMVRTLSAEAVDVDGIARAAAADLSQAFRGSLAPVRRIILESSSPAECQQRIAEFYADWSPNRLAALTAEALEAYSANGAVARV